MVHKPETSEINIYSDQFNGLVGIASPITRQTYAQPSGGHVAQTLPRDWSVGTMGHGWKHTSGAESQHRSIAAGGNINPAVGTHTVWYEKLTTGAAASQYHFDVWETTGVPSFHTGFNHEGYGGSPNYDIRFYLQLSDYQWATKNTSTSGGVPARQVYLSVGRYYYDTDSYYVGHELFNLTFETHPSFSPFVRSLSGASAARGIQHRFGQPGTPTFEVIVYESRYYDRLLSDAEVEALWQPDTRWSLYAPPKRYWTFPAGTVFPFTDNFTGTNDDPWSSAKWTPGY